MEASIINTGSKKHRLLIEHLPDAYAYHQIITDSNGNPVDYIVHDVNRAFEKMIGLSKGEVRGKKITAVFPGIKESSFDWIGTFGKVAISGKSLRFEHYYKAKDGWYEITAYSDEPDFFSVIIRDITDNKKAEQALKLNTALLESLIDSIPDLIFYKDMTGTYLGCNNEFARHVGCGKDDIVGKTDYDLYSKEMADFFRENDRLMLKLGRKRQNEEWISYPDGREILLDTLKTPFVDAEGRLIGIIGLSRDITERKQMEQELQESRNLLHSVFQSIQDGISVLNTDLTIKEVNKTMEKWYSYAMPLTGKKCYQVYQNRTTPCTPCPSIDAIANKKVSSKLVPLMDEDKTAGWLELFAYPLMDEIGNVNGVVEFVRDISDRKLAEQRLADYTLELERLYHQLDQELDKARQVHERTLSTSLPAVAGLSFAVHYQPAQIIGGDFYDMLQVENKLIFYLSDVSGHGLDGAMLSIFIKHMVSSYTSFTPAESISPASILSYLAKQYRQENYPEELYFCIFMAVLDLNTLELFYCGAGFGTEPLVLLGNGDKQKLTTQGLFITTLLPDEMLTLHEESIAITPGTTIFCSTDGLTEQRNNGTHYINRLPDVFYENAGLPPHLVIKAVLDDFRNFNNGSLQGKDDITFLVLQVDK